MSVLNHAQILRSANACAVRPAALNCDFDGSICMIGYTSVGTNDLEKAVHFYGELLSLLGAKPFFKSERGVGWGTSPD